MALYDATQIIGKTLVTRKNVNYYKVVDINEKGDKATKAGTLSNGTSFVVDSYLAPTPGYTSIYNITYAARSRPYFTFYLGGVYCACVIGDGFFNLDILQAQGAQTVQQQAETAAQEEYDATHPFSQFWKGLGLDKLFGSIKPILILILLIILAIYVLPHIMKAVEKKK